MARSPVDELLEHDEQLRALARRLLENKNDADDLVQEVYLSALGRRPNPPGTSTRWWRELLRLKARSLKYQETRRKRRELVAAVSEEDARVPANEEDTFLRRLALAVQELDEPYHTTMRMRFIEELPPREIARRTGVPVRTVYTRMTRGLKQLRSRMDREYENRSWIGVVLSFPREGGARGVSAALVAATLLVAATWVGFRVLAPDDSRGTEVAEHEASQPERSSQPFLLAEPAGEVDARRVLPPAVTAAATTTTATVGTTLAGRVVDPHGVPLAGVSVVSQSGVNASSDGQLGNWLFRAYGPETVETVSGPDGAFELSLDAEYRGRLFARSAELEPVIAELVPFPGRHRTLQLVAAPARSIRGRILDPPGNGVSGASLQLRASPDFSAAQRRPERSWLPAQSLLRSDERGFFEIEEGYAMEGAWIEVEAEGFAYTAFLLRGTDALDLELTIQPLPTSDPIAGFVVDGMGRLVEDAVVAAADTLVMTGNDGRFELETTGFRESETLWVIVAELLPVTLEVHRDEEEGFHLPDPFIIEVAEAPLVIEGRVVDAEGEPVPGAYVWSHDMTKVGTGRSAWLAEEFMNPFDANIPFNTETDAEGRFRLPFLMDRMYRIGSMNLDTKVGVLGDPVPAGTSDLVLTIPTDQPRSSVLGRVVTREGTPIPSATVVVYREVVAVSLSPGHNLTCMMHVATTETDAEGHFHLPELPNSAEVLTVQGADFVKNTLDLPVAVGGETRTVEVVVARRSRMRLVSHESFPAATHFGLFDPSGEQLVLFVANEIDRSSDMAPYNLIGLSRGRSPIVVGPDTATEIVFYQDDLELGRVPIRISADVLNELSL